MGRHLRVLLAVPLLAGISSYNLPAVQAAPGRAVVAPRVTAGALLDAINAKRTARGKDPLRRVAGISDIAHTTSQNNADSGILAHTPNLPRKLRPWNHTIYGENVGAGATIHDIMYTWMHSAVHKANILNSKFTRCGVGLVDDGAGLLWATVIFID